MKKQVWISYLRIAATLAVIWMHINSTVWANPELFSYSAEQARFFSVSYYLVKWAVPVFLMITGALLLNKDRVLTYRNCLLKYGRRVFLALVIFGFIYGAAMQVMTERSFSAAMLGRALLSVVTGDSFSHLWYLYMLLGIYLVLPVLKSFVNAVEKRSLTILMIVLLAVCFFFPFIKSLLGIDIRFEVPFAYPVFYLLAGYYMNTYQIKRPVILILALISVVLIVITALRNPVIDYKLLDLNDPYIAFFSMGVFELFRCIKKESTGKFVSGLDVLCFGVYLIHPAFIQVLYRVLGITPLRFGAYPLGSVVLFIGVAVLSFAASYILRLIPVVKKYIL